MTRLWQLWIDYCNRQPYPPSKRRFAMDIGMSPTAFGNWERSISDLPDEHNLARFARMIHMPYERVLDAALHDAGYLPEPREEVMGNVKHPAPNRKASRDAQRGSEQTREKIAKVTASKPKRRPARPKPDEGEQTA